MACVLQGNPAMYGLGIRVAFYLLWFGAVVAGWLVPRATGPFRSTLLLIAAATFLALIIQVSNNALRTIEVYIVLLLVYGAYYAYVPLYLWRLASGCSPFWDPARWPRAAPGRMWSLLNFVMLVAVTCFQLWFWITGINATPTLDPVCPDYGFFFAPVLLRNQLFIAFNIVLNILLLLCASAHMCLVIGLFGNPRWLRKKLRKARKKGISERRRLNLHVLRTLFQITAASLVVAATELTLQWNNITNVYDVTTTAQLIPLIIASALVGHVFWLFFIQQQLDDSESSSGSGSTSITIVEGIEIIVDY